MLETPNKGVENPTANPTDDLDSILNDFDKMIGEDTSQTSNLMGGGETVGEGSGEPLPTEEPKTMTSAEARANRKNLGEFMNPTLAVTIADYVLSRAGGIICSWVGVGGKRSKDGKITYGDAYKHFKLDAQEKADLKQPLADYLGTFDFKLDTPLGNLLLIVAIIYGGKIISIMALEAGDESDIKDIKKGSRETSRKLANEVEKGTDKFDGSGNIKPSFLSAEQKKERKRAQDREYQRRKKAERELSSNK